MIILKMEKLYGEYTDIISILPNELETTLREEGKTSENNLVDRMEQYIRLHNLSIDFPKEEIRRVINSHQMNYNNVVTNHSREVVGNGLHYIKQQVQENAPVNERIYCIEELLKQFNQVIGYTDDALVHLDYNEQLTKDIIQVFQKVNKSNYEQCRQEIEQMVYDFVSKDSKNRTDNVIDHMNQHYMPKLNQVHEGLGTVLTETIEKDSMTAPAMSK